MHLRTKFIFLWWLMMISPALLTFAVELEENQQQVEEDDVLTTELEREDETDPNDETEDIFVPTEDWKVVKDGQHIPPGLHVRINLQTGLKEAKLLDKEDSGTTEEPDNDRRAHSYGDSDRRGVINKRTKVFSAEELANMLKENDNNDNADLSNLPRIAAGPDSTDATLTNQETKAERKHKETKPVISTHMKNLPLSVHHDVEVMLELSRVLANESSTVAELSQALEELEYYVHQIRNAEDLNVIGGLVLVIRLLNHTHPDVKSWAAHVIGSASQSNPPVQEQVLEYGSLSLLCRLLSLSEPEIVQRRALFALSALLRGNIREQVNFIKHHHGLDILGKSFRERSPQMQLKAAVLLTDFLNNELTSSEHDDHQLELSILVHHELLSYGWCENVPALIHSNQLTTIEKGLLAMKALSVTCTFTAESARLRELVGQLERGSIGADLDVEYTDTLVEHCRSLLKHIHRQNLDL